MRGLVKIVEGVLGALLVLHALCASAATWVAPESFKTIPVILEKTGEHVLLYDSGDRASGAIYAVSGEYDVIALELVKLVDAQFGIATQDSSGAGSFFGLNDYSDQEVPDPQARDLWRHLWIDATSKMKATGFIVEGFSQTRIESKPYNVFANRNASSVLLIRVLDSSQLFGIPGALVLLYRRDAAREWGFANPHDPFSFGYKMHVRRLVTKTEDALLESWARQRKLPSKMVPFGSRPLPEYLKEWTEVRQFLESAKRQK